MRLIADINSLRAARDHLEAQIDVDPEVAGEAMHWLAVVNAKLAVLEARARDVPEAAYLFSRRRRRAPARPTSEGDRD